MPHRYVPLAVALLMLSQAAMATDTSQLRQYAALSTAAGDNDTGEIDHNADGMNGDDRNETYDTPSAPMTEAPPVPVLQPKPILKSPMVKKAASGTEVAAPKTAKAKPAPAREIPLIETENPVESSPDVNYVTGGIGEDEKNSIEAAKADYNLHVMSASINGAFVGDARVVIRSGGKELLNVVAGPLLYVKLPAGNYALDATLGEQKKHQDFTIGGKQNTANVYLAWNVSATRSNE